MAQWQTRCGLCKHHISYSGYLSITVCNLAECKYEPIVCTASNKTEMLPKEQWTVSNKTKVKGE